MIYSSLAIDYDAPLIFCPSGEIIPTNIGCFVMSVEEAEKCLLER
jgi:hypothetical protein